MSQHSRRAATARSVTSRAADTPTAHRPAHLGPTTDPAPDWLDIARHVVDRTVVVAASGEVDAQTAPALHAVVAAAVTDGTDQASALPCVLDLTAVTFLGAAGLTALLNATTHAEAQHRPLPIVVDGNRAVIRPIEVSGLDEALRLYHSLHDALTTGRQS